MPRESGKEKEKVPSESQQPLQAKQPEIDKAEKEGGLGTRALYGAIAPYVPLRDWSLNDYY